MFHPGCLVNIKGAYLVQEEGGATLESHPASILTVNKVSSHFKFSDFDS